MQVEGKRILSKLRDKNRGNLKLIRAIDQFIIDLESLQIDSLSDLKSVRGDFEKVHNNGFYFVDVHVHRVLVMIKVIRDEAKIVWVGSHDEYVRTFKNNKDSIEKWLRNNDLI